jgi:hypothetical protein
MRGRDGGVQSVRTSPAGPGRREACVEARAALRTAGHRARGAGSLLPQRPAQADVRRQMRELVGGHEVDQLDEGQQDTLTLAGHAMVEVQLLAVHAVVWHECRNGPPDALLDAIVGGAVVGAGATGPTQPVSTHAFGALRRVIASGSHHQFNRINVSPPGCPV